MGNSTPQLSASVMLLALKEDDTTVGFYLGSLLRVLNVILKSSVICTNVHLYTIIICTDVMVV